MTEASRIIGLDEEIALIRSRLKFLIKNSPDNIRLISQLASTLSRLMRTNQQLGFQAADDFERKRLKFLFEMGPSLGIDTERIIAGYLGKT